MRKDGVVGTTLYFSPKDKKHRDAYRLLSIYPRKKTEFVACLVQNFLHDKGISDIEQVSDDYLRKLIKLELQDNNYPGVGNQNLIGLLSTILQTPASATESTADITTDQKPSLPPQRKESYKTETEVKKIPQIQQYEENIPSTLPYPDNPLEEPSYEDETDETNDNNDDTTGLVDDWNDKLAAFNI